MRKGVAITTQPSSSLSAPSYLELGLIVLTGALHVGMEVVLKADARWLRIYNLSAAAVWGCYVVWRLRMTPGLAQAWGFRLDNFWPAWRRCISFVVPAIIGAFLYGGVRGRLPLPESFWLILLIYPMYGIAQQVAVQVFMNRNLRGLLPSLVARAGIIGVLFGAAHVPNWILASLTCCAGVVFTCIYERYPNVLAIGVAHGLLGTAVYYLVLGVDPMAEWRAGP